MQKDHIHEFRDGLHQDNIPENQPNQTLRFALNSVKESQLGNRPARAVENANEIYASLKKGYTPIGKVYIGDNKTVIFSVSEDNMISEIGILDDNATYNVIVNDITSVGDNKLTFKTEYQIDAIYRLRRGCDETIYFTDGFNPPRYFNISQPEDFKDPVTGQWVSRSFDLIKSFNKIPEVADVSILENNGNLVAGSYSVMIQYLDDDFNGTTFLTEIPNINIYNDSLTDQYNNIKGSSNIIDSEPYKYENTNKAIRVTYTGFDSSYNFYRLAFIKFTSNLGTATEVSYTDPIDINTNTFVYTGDNATVQGTLDELVLSNNAPVLLKAKNIDQIENRLLLSNTTGQEVEFCKLQRYASKIKADCVVKDTILTTVLDENNSKNPAVKFNGISYQPGEVYSFGVSYVFDDMTQSPVYHIPGKSPSIDPNTIFSPTNNTFPMSNVDNSNETEFYTDNSSCNGNSYWGLDSEGDTLLGANIRHHKFPTRNEEGIDFVKKEVINPEAISQYKRVRVNLLTNIRKSVVCKEGDTGCTAYSALPFRLIIRYDLDGEAQTFDVIINPDSQILPYYDGNIFLGSGVVTGLSISYRDETSSDETTLPLNDNKTAVQPNGGSYELTIEDSTEDLTTAIYSVPIFGIRFSDVELPPESVVGKKVIGYYIVRQDRRDTDKTILDSGVILPMIKNDNFVSAGMLAPDYDNCEEGVFNKNNCYRTSKRNFQLLTPLHKFVDKTFDNFSSIEEQGKYKVGKQSRTGMSYQNVYDGSSADGIDTNESTSDNDGMSLRQIIRYSELNYLPSNTTKFKTDNQDTKIYNLDGANYVEHEDNTETLYNLAADNKALIISKNNDEDLRTYRPGRKEYPYVYVKNANRTFYSNFRVNPYYRQTANLQTTPIVETYSGDIYIAPMRYSNHIYANAVSGTRRESLGFFEAFVAVLTVIVGAALAIFSGGSSLVIAGGILTAISGALMGAASVIETERFNDIYTDKWDKGLDKTVFDKFYHRYMWNTYIEGFSPLQWRDDTFKWYGDVLGDIWFETPINISLRVAPRNNINNFLLPLKAPMSDRPDKLSVLAQVGENDDDWDFQDDYYFYRDGKSLAEGEIENYFLKKITTVDADRKSGVKYTGLSIPQVYLLNTDHNVRTNVQEYFHLALSYDCCSDCNESFPHRWHWSEQSFQEELTDNYRTFLPNNYKDLSGETGEITNMFVLRNNLYMHTKESLWMQPRQNQERVTDQVVSFIGTGEFGSVPPRRIVEDDTGNSAGTQHKWSCIRTVHGYFFVSENQSKIYSFDGQGLRAISNLGLNNWFKDNIKLLANQQYYNSNAVEYKNNDNPSNPFGVGFISTYDSNKERILFTKKDFSFSGGVTTSDDFNVCTAGGQFYLFNGFNQTIQDQATQNFVYQGLEDCRMKFEKEIIKTKMEVRQIKTTVVVPNNADVVVQLDTSGSFNTNSRQQIKDAVINWRNNFAAQNPDWTGNLYFCIIGNSLESERSWKTLFWIKNGIGLQDINGNAVSASAVSPNIIAVSFVNENATSGGVDGGYHTKGIHNPIQAPGSAFTADYNEFITTYNTHVANGGTFKGLVYPIVYSHASQTWTQGYLQHTLAAVKGVSYTQAEVNEVPNNPFIPANSQATLKASLLANNPYPEDGLENYGWKGIWNRGYNGSGVVISSEQFQEDMDEFLAGSITTELTDVIVQVSFIDVETKHIEGILIQNPIKLNNGWTTSFSVKDTDWISWHSYIPNFYVNVPEKFYSWKYGNNNIWKHNVKGRYRTFYGEEYPHIIEYVNIVNPTNNYITNYIKLITKAEVFDTSANEFYEDKDTTFNKMVVYNNKQCSGEINLLVKEEQSLEDWFTVQTENNNTNNIIIDRTEDTWYINDLRDLRVDYNKPIWKSTITDRNSQYYIDKVLNTDTLDVNKEWYNLESFRGKHLVVRLIFDKFADRNLITNFSVSNEQESQY